MTAETISYRQRATKQKRCHGQCAALLALAAYVIPAISPAAPGPSETVLDNGLKLIMLEDRRAPVVVVQLWYKVGSSYEHDGITGISHALEHMMFKGTHRHGQGEFSRIVALNGGRQNAFTGADYTGYYQEFERSRVPVSFALEADRMQNLLLDEHEFSKEIQVVMEERRLRTDDRPLGRLRELTNAVAFQTSPYRQPVIGWMTDLQQLNVGALRDWYSQWYAPNNAVVVVVGDIDKSAVARQARQHFGPIAARPVPRPRANREVPQYGEKRALIIEPSAVPHLVASFKAPSLRIALLDDDIPDWHPYALELLKEVLGDAETGLLVRSLVRTEQLAAELQIDFDLYHRLDALFTVAAIPSPDQTLSDFETRLLKALRMQIATGFDVTALRRAKIRLRAKQIYQRDSLSFQAFQLGLLETVGVGWRARGSYLPAIDAVTTEQLQDVARAYLTASTMTITLLDPGHDDATN